MPVWLSRTALVSERSGRWGFVRDVGLFLP